MDYFSTYAAAGNACLRTSNRPEPLPWIPLAERGFFWGYLTASLVCLGGFALLYGFSYLIGG